MADQGLFDAVKSIKSAILRSRYIAARAANQEALNLYFAIGRYISANTRGKDKWGTGAIEKISKQLQVEMPGLRGFSPENMKKMRLFAEEWAPALLGDEDRQSETAESRQLETTEFRSLATTEIQLNVDVNVIIRSATTTELADAFTAIGFTHHMEILRRCKTVDERLYYIRECAKRFWTVEMLRNHLRNDDFHRIGTMSNNFTLTKPDASQAARAVMAFKDELLLDFINIKEETDDECIDERVLQREIVRNVKKFIQALGTDFSFVSDGFRLVEDGEEFFVDLLFYHRTLRRLVAIELKRGRFKASYIGQLNLYLSLLDKYERREGEEPSVGIILCRETKRSIVELSLRDVSKPMGIVTYRLGDNIPAELQSLVPIMEAADQLIPPAEEE